MGSQPVGGYRIEFLNQKIHIWLMVWNHGILWLSIQLGMSQSQLLLTPSFFRGVGQPPSRYIHQVPGAPPMATASSQRSLSSCIFQSSLCPAYSVPRTCFTTNCVIYVYNIYIYTSLINITYLCVVYLASSLPIYSLHPTYIYIYYLHMFLSQGTAKIPVMA